MPGAVAQVRTKTFVLTSAATGAKVLAPPAARDFAGLECTLPTSLRPSRTGLTLSLTLQRLSEQRPRHKLRARASRFTRR
jgi:hypothetical protein